MNACIFPCIAAAAGLAAVSPARAGNYVITTIDPPGSIETTVEGLNNRGQAVGVFYDASGVRHGFIWDHGTFTVSEPDPYGQYVNLFAINEGGVAVGWATGPNIPRAVTLRNGDPTLRHPVKIGSGWRGGYLVGINNHNVMVGSAIPAGQDKYHPFAVIVSGETVTGIPLPGATSSDLLGINNAGMAWGMYIVKGQIMARYFTYFNGIVTPVVFPRGDYQLNVNSVGEDGRVAGTLLDRSGDYMGVLYDGDSFERIRFPGAAATFVLAANGQGVFGTYNPSRVGVADTVFVRKDGAFHALASPPGAVETNLAAVAANGSFAGSFLGSSGADFTLHGFIAVCPPDQQPCTR